MKKPEALKRGDKVAIVSLSSGILGEKFVSHELELGVKRLKELGLIPVFMENSLKGLKFIDEHPEARAADLKQAFADPEIKGIISAIGGIDSYRLIPYLAGDAEFVKLVKENPKIFTGYSDTTTMHILLNHLGLNTFYGPAFITDFAEFEPEMLPYTKNAINYLFEPTSPLKILSSEIWYDERTDFSPNAVGTKRVFHKETRGYDVLKGKGKVIGELFGGCIESISRLAGFKSLPEDCHENLRQILSEHPIFPEANWFKNKILFLETSNEKASPEQFKAMLLCLKTYGICENISGLIMGKPMDETFYEEYKVALKEVLAEYNFPVMCNLNFGHSFPRMVLPYGAMAELDAENKSLTLLSLTIKK